MISVDVCRGKQVTSDVSPEQIRELLHGKNVTLWVDVSEPTEADWEMLGTQFDFHPLALEDAHRQNQRAKVDEYDGYVFLSVRNWTGFKGATDDIPDVTNEVDIFLGTNYLVTIHKKSYAALSETRKRWEQHADRLSDQPSFILYTLLDTIVDGYFLAIDALDIEIDKLEVIVYTPNAPLDHAPALVLKKQLLLLRQTISPMRDLLNHMLRAEHLLIAPSTRLYFQDVYDHTLRQVEQVDLHRDILSGVLDAMMAQTSNRLNQIMKTMTGISTILMTAALIAGIYGMNFEHMPELKARYGYYEALTAMALLSAALGWYFRRIKWF